uniref:Uncharacterized protein n=1 Tax=Kalanchoe fedtschenkoi TaxID=63787 RepID=A0A7N0RA22_KALFE
MSILSRLKPVGVRLFCCVFQILEEGYLAAGMLLEWSSYLFFSWRVTSFGWLGWCHLWLIWYQLCLCFSLGI